MKVDKTTRPRAINNIAEAMIHIMDHSRLIRSGCIIYTHGLRAGGRGAEYGCVVLKGKKEYVHRIVWLANKGRIPTGLYVLHRCDNPLCCNIDHLFLGTAKDNTQDMISKGRHPTMGKTNV